MSQYQDFQFLVFGESYVGKTSFLKQFIGEKFQQNRCTNTGIELSIFQQQIGDDKFKIHLWEFPGYSNFKQFARQYYKRTQGLILQQKNIFFLQFMILLSNYDQSLTYSRNSFDNIEHHYLEAIQHHDSLLSIILIGNKYDENNVRQVSYEEANELALKMGIKYLEMSVKTNYNMEQAIRISIQNILEQAQIKGINFKKTHIDNQAEQSSLVSLNNLKNKFSKCY